MRRLMGLTACISLFALTGVAYASEPDPETAQFMCDMTGDCSGEADAATTASEPAPAAAPAKGARTSSTRGFSFQRATTDGQAAAPAPSTPRPTQVASAPPVQKSINRPAQVGSANLNLTFVSGSAILTEPAKARLAKFATVLAGPKFANRRLRIEGHTDASGSQRSNQALSQRRAQAVADFLVAAGLPASRFEVVGFGSSRLLPGIASDSAANRRVMAVLL